MTFLQDVVPQVISLLHVFSLCSSWKAVIFFLSCSVNGQGTEEMIEPLEINSDFNNNHC